MSEISFTDNQEPRVVRMRRTLRRMMKLLEDLHGVSLPEWLFTDSQEVRR